MSQSTSAYARLVFLFSVSGYVPITVGGWQHPSEINIASYGIWLLIAALLLYSSWKQRFAGLLMPMGFCVGNFWMCLLGVGYGGYTFNLGPAETVALYGIIGTISSWAVVGQTTGKWSPRILYLGGILAEALSYYPQWKQYLLPHDSPTRWMIAGWYLSMTGVVINVVLVEQLFKKLLMTSEQYELRYSKTKHLALIIEESAFSIENCVLGNFTIFLMTR